MAARPPRHPRRPPSPPPGSGKTVAFCAPLLLHLRAQRSAARRAALEAEQAHERAQQLAAGGVSQVRPLCSAWCLAACILLLWLGCAVRAGMPCFPLVAGTRTCFLFANGMPCFLVEEQEDNRRALGT